MSRYACPLHHERVTWRGTGCPVCEADKRASTKRHSTRPTDDVPGWARTEQEINR